MNTNKLCVGIDLGDRTFSMDAVKLFPAEISPIQLPGQKGNDPILSAVGRHKDGSMELLRTGDSYRVDTFSDIAVNFKCKPSDTDSAGMALYRKGTQDLLRLVLCDPQTVKHIMNLSNNCAEIQFCVGYPTNWTQTDVDSLKTIIGGSILGDQAYLKKAFGKPVYVKLERESTAAFIYARTYQKELGIRRNSILMVLDFGSSTVNVTALTIGERNTKYNSGHNFFGGRMIDCVLADYYIRQISEADRNRIKDLDRLNNGAASAMILLAACEAKERLNSEKTVRMYTDFVNKAVMISQDHMSALLDKPLAPMVERFHQIPDKELKRFGTRSWRQILKDYLCEEQGRLQRVQIIPDYIIATGGGALLRDVREICNSVFSGRVRFFEASDTTRVISRGLALASRRIEKSAKFREEIDAFLQQRMPALVRAELSSLSDGVSARIADLIRDEAILPKMRLWRDGAFGYSTLDITSENIANYCASSVFEDQLKQDSTIKQAIKKWSEEKVGAAIASELELICNRYGVKGFTINNLNVLRMPTISVGGSMASPVLEAITNLIGIIAAIIAATISTDALVLVLSIIALFLPGLAYAIATVIAAIPGGLIVLAGIAGIAVFNLIRKGWESFKDDIIRNISRADIPVIFRKAITDNSICKSINDKRDETIRKIKSSISDGQNATKISKQISDEVGKQILPKIDEILYALEQQ